jgi:hypothetical protein
MSLLGALRPRVNMTEDAAKRGSDPIGPIGVEESVAIRTRDNVYSLL